MADPADIAQVLTSATANAAGMDSANKQMAAKDPNAPQSSWTDVWKHTGEGLKQRAADPTGGGDFGPGLAEGIMGKWHSVSGDAAATSARAQAGDAWKKFKVLTGMAAPDPGDVAPTGILGKIGATFDLLTSLEQIISMPIAMIPFPALPAIRIMDMDIGLPHAHMHPPNFIPPAPPIPLPSTGPIIPIPFLSGATRTLINAMPAARCGDMGLGIWCGGYVPLYEVFLGSSNVWVEGARAGRLFVDITKHCGSFDPGVGAVIGFTISASPNVIIGGVPMPSLLSFLMGGIFKGLFKALGKALGLLKKTKIFSRLKAMLKSRKAPANKACAKPGCPVYVLTGATVDTFLDYEIPGGIPFQWRRHYDSAMSHNEGPIGRGFRHEYQRELRRTEKGFAYIDQEGDTAEFPHIPAGRDQVVFDGLLLRKIDPTLYEIEETGCPIMGFRFLNGEVAPLVHLRSREERIDLFYDSRGRLSGLRGSFGGPVRIEYDHRDHIVALMLTPDDGQALTLASYWYSVAGNLIIWRDALGAEGKYEYDAGNRMTRITDRNGYSFNHAYDAQGRCVHSVGDDGLYEDWFDYRPADRCTIRTTGDGGRWVYRFDKWGTIAEIVDPYGGSTVFKMDPLGQIVEEIDPGGSATKYIYDERGSHTGRFDPFGRLLPPIHVEPAPPEVSYYDPPQTPREWEYGNLLNGERQPESIAEDPALRHLPIEYVDRLLSRLDGGGFPPTEDGGAHPSSPATVRLDAMQRPIHNVAPTGGIRQWQYDPNGNLTRHIDADGGTRRFKYSSWNLKEQETDPLGHTTHFEYSRRRDVTRVVDPGGADHQFVYDLKDRLIEVRRDGRLMEQYRYDHADSLIEKLDSEGRPLVSFEIGPRNAHKARILASGERQAFEYDWLGRITCAATDDLEVVFDYEAYGRICRDERDGKGIVHGFLGLDLAITEVFGRFITTYDRDPESPSAIIIKDPTGALHRIQTTGTGLVSKSLSNGTVELAAYDDRGRCLRKLRTSPAHPDLAREHAYEYSGEGRLTRRVDDHSRTTTYLYDAAGRLSGEIPPDGRKSAFEYDAAGNLLRQPGLADVRVLPGNLLGSANGKSFLHDSRYGISERSGPAGPTRYEYDSLDRLIRCDRNGSTWQAQYDPLGRRIHKAWGDGEQRTFYWDNARLAAEVRTDGSLRVYVYPDERALVPFLFIEYVNVDADPTSGRRYFVFTDQIGTPTQVEDDSGTTVWTARIEPYGRAVIDPASAIEMPLRRPGHYYDEETGLCYNRFRYYDALLARYIQSDPVGISGSLNLYAYPTDPLTAVDIDGLSGCPGQKGPNNAAQAAGQSGPNAQNAAPPPTAKPKLSAAQRAKVAKEFQEWSAKNPGQVWKSKPQAVADFEAGKTLPNGHQYGKSVKDLDLRGKTPDQIDAELQSKGFTKQPGYINDPKTGQPILDKNGQPMRQDFYTHPDGGMVRVKPDGHAGSPREQPHASKSVRDPYDANTDFKNEGFKVDNDGNAQPKYPKDMNNPHPTGSAENAAFENGWAETVHTDLQ